MARSYHVDIAQYAADADPKWIDNLLSHHAIPGVQAGRRGVSRRVTTHGIYHIALIRRLSRDLGLPVAAAADTAARLLATDATHVPITAGVELRIDRAAFARDIDRRIAEAVEVVAPARRGRPPSRATSEY